MRFKLQKIEEKIDFVDYYIEEYVFKFIFQNKMSNNAR